MLSAEMKIGTASRLVTTLRAAGAVLGLAGALALAVARTAARVSARSTARLNLAAPALKRNWRLSISRPFLAGLDNASETNSSSRRPAAVKLLPPEYRLDVAIRESVSSTLVKIDGNARGQIYNLDAQLYSDAHRRQKSGSLGSQLWPRRLSTAWPRFSPMCVPGKTQKTARPRPWARNCAPVSLAYFAQPV